MSIESSNKIWSEKYFSWLCELINLDIDKYELLIRELYNIQFFWILELDSDRQYDGIVLRGECGEEYVGIDKLHDKPCSVLEVMISLARDMNDILDDEDRGDRTRIWFWEMISNLGLDEFTNECLDGEYGAGLVYFNDIQKICNTWLSRKFDYNGRGSPFPLNHPHDDQRKLDMIRQLNAYILENYIVNDEPM